MMNFLKVLEENYEAAKSLTAEDQKRPAQELLLETYEDLISIYKSQPAPSKDEPGMREAIDILKWIAGYEHKEPGSEISDKIILCDGEWYWESDKDGDMPISEEKLYQLYKSKL